MTAGEGLRCERCGGPLARRNPWLLLLVPVALGGGAIVFAVLSVESLGVGPVLAIVTVAFAGFLLALGPLARAMTARPRCAVCAARDSP